jgi:hypothetical protein
MSQNILTPVFVGSFPNILEPKLNELNDKMEYSIVALFPKGADLSKLQAAAKEVIEKKWGTDKKKWPKNLRSPFRDQGEREKENDDGKMVLPPGHEKGAIFMNFKTKDKPGVVDAKNQPIIDSSEVYAGAKYRASVRPFAYDTKGNCGVSFGLQNIQKVGEGESLSGRVKAEDEFAPIETDGEGTASSTDDLFAS